MGRQKANLGSRWRNHLFGSTCSTSSIGPEHFVVARTKECSRSRQTPRRSRYSKKPHQTIRSIHWQEIRTSSRSTSFSRLQKVKKNQQRLFSLHYFSESFYFCLKLIFDLNKCKKKKKKKKKYSALKPLFKKKKKKKKK